MSVGEWLNSVIKTNDDEEFAEEDRRRQPPSDANQHGRDRIDGEVTPVRYDGRPYRDERRGDREERRRDRDAYRRDREDHPRQERDRDDAREAAREKSRRHEAAREEAQRFNAAREAAREEARREAARTREGLGEVHTRLDKLSAQLERLAGAEVARQGAASATPREPTEERKPLLTGAPPQRRRARPEPSLSIEDAVVEIAARQRALDGEAAASGGGPAPDGEAAAPVPPAKRGPALDGESTAPIPAIGRGSMLDMGGLEKQLRQITARIEALAPTWDSEKAIAAVRTDLAEIGRQLNEALPRRALESLELEVKALAERIDHSRQSGVDPNALAGLEGGLAEVREALRALTPAESLVGFDQAVNALAQKVDMILARDDPAALQQLEAAIGGLRGVVSHVASNDTLTRVAEDVRALAAQVDGIANNTATGHAVSALEQRIDTLAAALTASSEAGHAVPRDLEKLLAGLIEKLEWVQLTHTDHAALAHLEDRIATLVQRFDASDARLGHLEAIERGLADLLVHIEQMRGINGSVGAGAMLAPPAARAIERDFAAIKQSERRTQDSLEAVQGTVEHVVDRLATIESDLRGDATPRAMPEPSAAAPPQQPIAPHEAAPTESGAAPSLAPEPVRAPTPAPAPLIAAVRPPIDPTLPPDHPLEPGTTAGRSRPNPSAADRIAASEAAIASAKPPVIADSGRPNFIAAARRAAQAAAWNRSGQKAKDEAGPEATAQPNKLSQRMRKLIVAGGAVLILIGCVRIATRLFDDGGSGAAPQAHSEQVLPSAETPAAAIPAKQPPTEASPPPLPNPTLAAPPNRAPTTKGAKPRRQSMVHEGTDEPVVGAVTPPAAEQPGAMAMPLWASPDITGALPHPETAPSIAPALGRTAGIVNDKLPATIGDPALRKAAMTGDPAAAYEVATRFAEGRGVLQNNQAAAHWLERAAKEGLAPAQFRLGGLYEKGLGVKKDLATARDLYLAAAEKGNGKAMHNLAVLYAEGVNGPPDYNKAAVWFRKAADRGIGDSQYNLGILYARGIGVEQNDAESYKWFALAANRGDKEAAKKRDEVASRLDPQSLAAARLAVKNWAPEPQPEAAIGVKTAAAWNLAGKGTRTVKRK